MTAGEFLYRIMLATDLVQKDFECSLVYSHMIALEEFAWSRFIRHCNSDKYVCLHDRKVHLFYIHSNYKISFAYSQVTFLQKCQPEFLHDLVLKMKMTIYTPGDYVCRKGEIAREMYVISDGILEVIR